MATLGTSVGLQLTQGCNRTHTVTTAEQQAALRENNMQSDDVPVIPEVTKQAERSRLVKLRGNKNNYRRRLEFGFPAASG